MKFNEVIGDISLDVNHAGGMDLAEMVTPFWVWALYVISSKQWEI